MCVQAEEQVYEEVAERRWGLQCAGGGSGLPGCALCSICPPTAGRDAGSLNGSPCSHQVTHLWRHSKHRASREFHTETRENFTFWFVSAGFYSSCLDPKAKPSHTMRSAEQSPRWCLTRLTFHSHQHLHNNILLSVKRKTASVGASLRLVLNVQELNSQSQDEVNFIPNLGLLLFWVFWPYLCLGLPRYCVQSQGQTGSAGRDWWVPGRGDCAPSWGMGPGHQDRAAQKPPSTRQKVQPKQWNASNKEGP